MQSIQTIYKYEYVGVGRRPKFLEDFSITTNGIQFQNDNQLLSTKHISISLADLTEASRTVNKSKS